MARNDDRMKPASLDAHCPGKPLGQLSNSGYELSAQVMDALSEHLGDDQHAALFGEVEAASIVRCVDADAHALGDAAVLVDDGVAHHGVRPDLGPRQDHRVLDAA